MADRFVLDTAVTIRWALRDGSVADRTYADRVLESFAVCSAWVPALWYTETIHVLRVAEDDGKFGESALAGFVYRLGQLPINHDDVALFDIQLAVAAISREFKLSGYDAQYLELARRRSVPIATLDKDLRKAARKAGVPVYMLQ